MKLSKWVIYHSKAKNAPVLIRRNTYVPWDGPVLATHRTQDAATADLARRERTIEHASRSLRPPVRPKPLR